MRLRHSERIDARAHRDRMEIECAPRKARDVEFVFEIGGSPLDAIAYLPSAGTCPG